MHLAAVAAADEALNFLSKKTEISSDHHFVFKWTQYENEIRVKKLRKLMI